MSQIRNDPKDISVLLNEVLLSTQNGAGSKSPDSTQLPPEAIKLITGNDLPTLPQGPLSNKNISLEILLGAIGEELRKTDTNAGLASIKANADVRAAKNQEMIKKIEENIKELEKASVWDKISKAFAWIGAIAAVVASAALVATGVGAVAVAGLVVACVALANQVLDTVGESVDGQGWGLTTWAAKGLGKVFGEDSEMWIKMGLDLAFAITSIALSCGTNAGQALNSATKAVSTLSKVATSVQTASTLVSSGTKIASGVYTYQASQTQADKKKLEAILEQIRMMNELITKHLEKSMEEGQKLTETVTDIVQEQNASVAAIVTQAGGAAGSA